MGTTRKQLDGITAQLNSIRPQGSGWYYVEGSASGWNLYREANPGATEIVFGRTKDELWYLIRAYIDGMEIALHEMWKVER